MFYIGTLLGFIGVFYYLVDRVVIDIFQQFKEVIGESLKQKGNLSVTDQQLIAFWTRISGSDTRKVTMFTKASSFLTSAYRYFVPGSVRFVLFIPTYVVTYPVRLFVGKRKMEALREHNHEISLKGLWSFTVPLAFAILAASLFVQEVEYMGVVNGQGPDSSNIEENLVKRVVIGIARFSFALPHHPVVYGMSYVLVLFAVFHTVNVFVILSSYDKPS